MDNTEDNIKAAWTVAQEGPCLNRSCRGPWIPIDDTQHRSDVQAVKKRMGLPAEDTLPAA
jgi:hypothetical protein